MENSNTPKNFIVYRSSAGSGKTFTLVKEYLKIVILKPERYRNILAITFTNKAAEEMRSRILNYLSDIVYWQKGEDYPPILEQLILDLNLEPGHIQQNARKCLNNILHDFSGFSISTIDSFMYKIIRTFSIDMDLPTNAELIIENKDILNNTISLLLSRVGKDEYLTKVLLKYIVEQSEDEKGINIHKDLSKFSTLSISDASSDHINNLLSIDDELFEKTGKELRKKILLYEKELQSKAMLLLEKIAAAGLKIKDFKWANSGSVYSYLRKASSLDFSGILSSKRVNKSLEDGDIYGGKIDQSTRDRIDQLKETIFSTINDIIGVHLKQGEIYYSQKVIYQHYYSLSLVRQILNTLDEYKKSNNLIIVSEFNQLISQIALNEPIPFIYERIGVKYQYFLIDEFQDTSVIQFHNLLPLIDNALSENHLCIVVGDSKQSIYRWRGGEYELLSSLPKLIHADDLPFIKERQEALERNYQAIDLKSNYRSKRHIVEFNNKFFSSMKESIKDQYQYVYGQIEQTFQPKNQGGFVEIKLSEAKNKEELNQDNKTWVLDYLKELEQQGIESRDICILVRKHEQARVLATFLLENNIHVISSESLILNNSARVRILINTIKQILSPPNKLHLSEMIYDMFEINYINKDQLDLSHKLIAQHKKDAQQEADFLQSIFNEYLPQKLQKGLLSENIYDISERLINHFEMDSQADVYIQFFRESVHEAMVKIGPSAHEFINWWDQIGFERNVITPEGIDAVRIMTIHKAKGLEFPVVIFPFAKLDDQVKSWSTLWVHPDESVQIPLKSALVKATKSLEQTQFHKDFKIEQDKVHIDALNSIYVAFTRPTDRLYVITNCEKIKNTLAAMKELMPNENILSYGLKPVLPPKEDSLIKQEVTQESPTSYQRLDWKKELVFRRSAPEEWIYGEDEVKTKQGELLHDMLAKIKSTDDFINIDKMFDQSVTSSADYETVKKLINKMFDYPEINSYFSPKLRVWNEQEIIDKNGHSHRPDRVIIMDDQATIIDYKTGIEKRWHKDQVNKYADLVEDLGYSIKEKVLIYIGDKIRLIRF